MLFCSGCQAEPTDHRPNLLWSCSFKHGDDAPAVLCLLSIFLPCPISASSPSPLPSRMSCIWASSCSRFLPVKMQFFLLVWGQPLGFFKAPGLIWLEALNKHPALQAALSASVGVRADTDFCMQTCVTLLPRDSRWLQSCPDWGWRLCRTANAWHACVNRVMWRPYRRTLQRQSEFNQQLSFVAQPVAIKTFIKHE